MIGPMLVQLLGQGLLEGPKKAVETATTRIVFAAIAAVLGIMALIVLLYALFLWLAIYHGPLVAAAAIGAGLAVLTGICVAVVCWPVKPRVTTPATPPAPPPPEAEAVLAIEQLGRSLGHLGQGKNGGIATLGILAAVAAVGYGIGRK